VHENGTDHAEEKRKSDIKCGTWLFYLNDSGGYWWEKPCNKWSCDHCREIKISDLQAQVCKAVPGPHAFITEVNKMGRSLTQWIQRHIPKKCDYSTVKKPGGALLITRYKIHESSKRRSRDKFLKGQYADLLRQPMVVGQRITHRKGQNKKQELKGYYGIFIQSDDGDTMEQRRKNERDYRGIKSDLERGHWLTVHRDSIILFGKGKRLVEDYQRHMEEAGH